MLPGAHIQQCVASASLESSENTYLVFRAALLKAKCSKPYTSGGRKQVDTVRVCAADFLALTSQRRDRGERHDAPKDGGVSKTDKLPNKARGASPEQSQC